MRRGIALAIVWLGAAACNELLGLESAQPGSEDSDSDGDGFADSEDSCPFVPNPDQADSDNDQRGDACDDCPLNLPTRDRDADGIDDACDPCRLGGPHDEDVDGVADACDLCPGMPADQTDTEGDTVGDACDPSQGINDRVLFDAFRTLDARWTSTATWTSDGDGVTPVVGSRLECKDAERARLSIAAMFDVLPDGEVGVGMKFGSEDARCELRCTGSSCSLVLTLAGSPQTSPVTLAPGKVVLHLWYGNALGTLRRPSCHVIDLGGQIVGLDANVLWQGLGIPFVMASPGSTVMHADIIQ